MAAQKSTEQPWRRSLESNNKLLVCVEVICVRRSITLGNEASLEADWWKSYTVSVTQI